MPSPNNYKEELMEGVHDHINDTVKVALGDNTTAYSFNADSHNHVSDVFDGGTTGQEMSGTGYTRKTLGGKSVTQDDTDDEGVFDANDVTWSGLDAGTIQFIVVYQQQGVDDTTPGDDNLIVVLDDTDVADLTLTTNGSDVTIAWASEGIVNIA